jgi:hypothetical protein
MKALLPNFVGVNYHLNFRKSYILNVIHENDTDNLLT